MSNSNPTGSIESKASKVESYEVTAETVYKGLNELKAMAQGVFEQQIVINEKLINNPVDTGEKSKAEDDRAVNPRHFPAFRDLAKDITERLFHTQRLQEHLLKHI